ncbi:carbohydrate kinase family protein [Sphingomonas colocasiae]|uniref:Carbohydrate kinase family protein n=1 Tax=Sphingomonas colocasiae TaxID=1848973 RepID=A0ABS7PVX6_9SPHN|nr:carbohydrate kinase family protein [Sphingomonas colocasiae]MBY8825520.1 carbohydrate kinase family protein [Sphingomonas colocasiae]
MQRNALDILAIGALNIDYIADINVDAVEHRGLVEALRAQFRWGSETPVAPTIFTELLTVLNAHIGSTRLGGSAFNAIRAARAINSELHLGYLGTIGDSEDARGFADWFDRHIIETPFVTVASGTAPGACLAITIDGERTLVTTRGANDRTAQSLRDQAPHIVGWAAAAAWIHVTSFLDDAAPAALVPILATCLRRNPALRISVDPGAIWAARHATDESIRRLFDLAALIFVNVEEFEMLWGDGVVSPADFTRCIRSSFEGSAEILLKSPDGLMLFGADSRLIDAHRHQRIAASEITDPTGAGDVVAGAYLAAMLEPAVSPGAALAAASGIARAALKEGHQAEAIYPRLFAKALAASHRPT